MRRLLFATLLLTIPLAAQPMENENETRVFRHEVELQLYRFGNFFQAREGQPEEDVIGFGTEYRAAWRRAPGQPDLYGALNVLRYGGEVGETSYGGRIGASHYGEVHSFNVALDRQENGYSFDVGDRTASASITSLTGQYTYRIARDWEVGAETYLEWQRFDVDTGFENDYQSLGAQVRYRGFGRIVRPRVGYVVGERDVETATESYDDRYWYVQLDSIPHERVTASLRYRGRTRDYAGPRTDDRDQWRLRGQFRQTDRFAWTASYTRERTTSSVASRGAFDTDVLFAGIIMGF
ncbi:MAG TPA: hypothetical protein VF432_22380 [Thermoanaerobaculia bacterium]